MWLQCFAKRPSTHSYLTVASPIREDEAQEISPAMAIRELLLASNQNTSPFRDCPMVHMARLAILHDVVPALGDRAGDQLATKYLLFVAELDGRVDDFLDHFYAEHGDFAQSLWGHCYGYPPFGGAVFFRRYMARCTQSVELPYASHPDSVEELLMHLKVQDEMRKFALAHASDDPEALLRGFREFEQQLDALKPARSGSIEGGADVSR